MKLTSPCSGLHRKLLSIAPSLVAALVAVLASPCHAQKPKVDPPIPLDDSAANSNNLSLALKNKCPDTYGTLSSFQRKRVIKSFKQALKLMIGIYIEDDGNECNPFLGAAMTNFCDSKKKKVNIVIDFDQKQPVKVIPDGSTKATPMDTISISGRVFKKLPGILDGKDHTGTDSARPLPDTTSQSYRRFFVDLMAEALRIKHETSLAGVADSSALGFKNDVEVARRKLDIEKDLKEDLKQYLTDPFAFTNSKYGVNRRQFRKIGKLPENQRKPAAEAVLKYLCDTRIPAIEKGLVVDWAKFKKKFGLPGNLGVDKIDENLEEIIENNSQPINFELWTDPSKKFAAFSLPEEFTDPETDHAYVGGGGSYDFGGGSPETLGDTFITQTLAGTFETTLLEVTGVDHIYHATLTDGGQTLLVSGGIDATGDGVIIGYSDLNGDGLFEPATRTEAIRDFDIYGGTHFLTDPSSGALLIFGRAAQALYQLDDSGGAAHVFPDTLSFRGSLGFQRFDLELAKVSEDGLIAWATGGTDFPFSASTLVPYSVASTAGGEFMPVSGNDYFPFNDDEREPLALRRPVEGDTLALASGRPGATLMADEVSGIALSLGAAVVGADGTATISLSQALSTTDIIRFSDTTTLESSPDHTVISSAMPPTITSVRIVPYGKLLINFEGVPGYGANLGNSQTLTIPFAEIALPPLDDIGTSYYEADLTVPAEFFRIGTFPPGG